MNILKKYKTFVLYGIIGGASASLDFMIYSFILYFRPLSNVLLVNAFSVVCGILCSFILNRQFNFKVKDKTVKRFMLFFATGILGLIISSILIYLTVDCWNLNKLFSKIITIGIVSIIQFLINKSITFKSEPQRQYEI